MIDFNRDPVKLSKATELYRHKMLGFEPFEWLSIPENIAISDGNGNYSLFEEGSDEVYTGHYFFNLRGKAAKALAEEMLSFLFENTGIRVIRGLTPLSNLAARWMSRQIGFKSQGVVHTDAGPCELFIMTKDK